MDPGCYIDIYMIQSQSSHRVFPYTTLFRSPLGHTAPARRSRAGSLNLVPGQRRSEEHTSELQSPYEILRRLLFEQKNVQHIADPEEFREAEMAHPLYLRGCYLADATNRRLA